MAADTLEARRLVGAGELARVLDVSTHTVRRLSRAGRLPYLEVGPRLIKFDVDQVLAALAARVTARDAG